MYDRMLSGSRRRPRRSAARAAGPGKGRVLEIGARTGLNLEPARSRSTRSSSPSGGADGAAPFHQLGEARRSAQVVALRQPRACRSRTTPSTRSSAHSCCARSTILNARFPRSRGSCGPAGSSCSWNTSARKTRSSLAGGPPGETPGEYSGGCNPNRPTPAFIEGSSSRSKRSRSASSLSAPDRPATRVRPRSRRLSTAPASSGSCAFCQIGRSDRQSCRLRGRPLTRIPRQPPAVPGHSLLVPREHHETLLDLPDD